MLKTCAKINKSQPENKVMSHNKITLAIDRVDMNGIISAQERPPHIFTPGEEISKISNYMRGHGTYVDGDSLKASVAGVVQKVNQLVSVQPLKSRYVGEIGDVVVGRIIDVQQKRWRIDTNSRLDSVLLLSSVNLPGGELRRRSAEDEVAMRGYLSEGALISAEVQNIFEEGTLSLYTRSLKYGKLSQGVLVKVFPSLIKRRKSHFHNLACGASIILGNNGYIYITPVKSNDENESGGGYAQNLDEHIPLADREIIARLRNCILSLAKCKLMLYDTSIQYAYEESMKYEIHELLEQHAMYDVGLMTQVRIKKEEENAKM